MLSKEVLSLLPQRYSAIRSELSPLMQEDTEGDWVRVSEVGELLDSALGLIDAFRRASIKDEETKKRGEGID